MKMYLGLVFGLVVIAFSNTENSTCKVIGSYEKEGCDSIEVINVKECSKFIYGENNLNPTHIIVQKIFTPYSIDTVFKSMYLGYTEQFDTTEEIQSKRLNPKHIVKIDTIGSTIFHHMPPPCVIEGGGIGADALYVILKHCVISDTVNSVISNLIGCGGISYWPKPDEDSVDVKFDYCWNKSKSNYSCIRKDIRMKEGKEYNERFGDSAFYSAKYRRIN